MEARMGALFTIVQYVPDPLADERMNVGVLVVEGGRIEGRFLREWNRVRTFGGEDVSFLRDFAYRVNQWTPDHPEIPGLAAGVRLDEKGLQDIVGRWHNSIQFTPLRASLSSPQELLDQLAARYLRHAPRKRTGYRDRRKAAQIAFRELEDAFLPVLGPDSNASISRNAVIPGKLDHHQFDVSIENGTPYLAAHGLSFEGPHSKDLEKEIDATAWAIDDVKSADKSLDLAVLVLPPKSAKSKTFDRAVHVFEGLKAEVVEEPEAESWAQEHAKRLEKRLINA
jgi:hypothetical protein